jgi:hypothetical protein
MENTLSTSDERYREAAIGAKRQLESGVEHVFSTGSRASRRALKMPIAVVMSHVKRRSTRANA